ncbi:MAG: FAD-binding and (Fe-S)-binding domain-containing protein [Smithellaceae bacterium]|nr:FAD-binding and (Fe-S)-binding domain-containing protein [Smithellaceae bacterium]
MQEPQRSYLREKFGNRVNFSKRERKLYGHDIAAMPGIIKPLVGNTVPDAVIQPETEEELSTLARWAGDQRIPLTPRGKATSGYGGVLPIEGGIVVDFFRLSKVTAVDPAVGTVTCQSGISWEKLDAALAKEGMTVRLYPSSYPGSTVGGWLAQGGAGFGSYEYGWFKENIVSARIVLPDGTVRTISGQDLDMVADAEGITGFISELTMKVMALEDLQILAVGCPDAHDLQRLIETITDASLPIWSLVFINPRMAELRNRAPLMMHNGHPIEERVLLPASYIMTLAFRKKDEGEVMAVLPRLLHPCQASILSEKIAHHEWKNRFKLMVVKRLGPSLVPTEVVIPLSALGDTMTEIENSISQPLVKEGTVIRLGKDGKPEVVILGFIPADQRRFGYNLVFPLSLSVMKIAERNGGRPYATGLYFKIKGEKVLGKERLKRLRHFKKEVDPRGIMNPGKVLGHGILDTAMAAGSAFEPLIRPLGNYVIPNIGERHDRPRRDIPADVAWYAYSCSQCGYCVEQCDQYYGRGWESQSPRGKWYWLREYMEGREDWDQEMVDTILVCTTCEQCNLRCSESLPIEPAWMTLRGLLIQDEKRMTFPPFEIMAEALRTEGNIWAGYRKNRTDWFPDDLRSKHGPGHKADIVYFAGCTASYIEKDIGMAGVRLLDQAGIDFTYLGAVENCCGTPILVAGKWDLFAETMKKNIAAVRSAGAKVVVASCPACDMMWRNVYPVWAKKEGVAFDIKVRHYTELVADRLKDGSFTFPPNSLPPTKVTWHDSCHIGRASGIYEPPREVIRAIPNVNLVEMSHHHENSHCCASVLTLIKEPPVAADIGKVRIDEAIEAGAEKILALCPCCQFQLRIAAKKKQLPMETVDLARFACSTMGFDFPDPNPEVTRQWAVFEAMIALMTPKGFAELMDTMWPELIDAMPFGMGPMMKVMGKVPVALPLMKPMFPVLFPWLLPMMMPKVMPVMLERVGRLIEMPDYMAEQMPELMPKVMANLMPHMIGDLVPLVTQPMIDYLKKA